MKKRIDSIIAFLRKKSTWVPLALIASVCTLILVFKSCKDDMKDKEINKNLSIIQSSFKKLEPIELSDTILLKEPIVFEAREIQEKILFFRDFVSLININIDENVLEESVYNFYFSKFLSYYYAITMIQGLKDKYANVVSAAISEGINCANEAELSSLEVIFQNDSISKLQKNDKNVIWALSNSQHSITESIVEMKGNSKDEEHAALFNHLYCWSERAFIQLNKMQEEKQIKTNR